MMTAYGVLLVDDDEALRAALAEQLEMTGEFEVVQAAELEAGRAAAARRRFDALILDVGLPDGDGRDLCRELRSTGVTAPILMLTAATTESDTITGLEAGANDYVSKPFRLGELIARLRAHLRQYESSDEAVLRIGPYDFKPGVKRLEDRETGKRIRLTEKESGILKYLYRADPPLVSREELLGEVWGYNSNVTTHTLETHIYRLRRKIEPDPGQACLLVTGQGGYRLGEAARAPG